MPDATHQLAEEERLSFVARDQVLLLFLSNETVRALALREGRSIVVGRAEPATVIIDDQSLSRTHACIGLQHGEVAIEDLGSTNGSFVNGSRVKQALLREGDVAQLGTIELRIAARASPPVQADAGISHAEFMRQLADEIQRARLFGRSATVIALRAPGDVGGPATVLALRPVDRLCRLAPGLSLIMRVESDALAASEWLEALNGRGKQPRTAGVASYPAFPCGAEALVSHALDAVHQAKPGTTRCAATPVERAAAHVILSSCMQRVYELVTRAARTTLPVLVLGETGSGKELVARAVHERSPRAQASFKALNCATIPASLVESILFGHERGAFTGADKQAQGIFEQAQGGSVFLDEVGELSPQVQAALLRVLEQRRIVRVGGTREIEVDVRVVAATHRDLAAMVVAGTFRGDLMFRLDALSVRVPPLRERPEEIVPLAELFLSRARDQWGVSVRRLSEDATEALLMYAWPGNVRQLKNVIERAAAVCVGEVIELEDLPEQVCAEPPAPAGQAGSKPVGGTSSFRSFPDRVREFEVGLLREALAKAEGNQAQAARILGLPRRTMTNKVHAYALLTDPERHET